MTQTTFQKTSGIGSVTRSTFARQEVRALRWLQWRSCALRPSGPRVCDPQRSATKQTPRATPARKSQIVNCKSLLQL